MNPALAIRLARGFANIYHMKKNTYNQSFWFYKPDSTLSFGMHSGTKIVDIIKKDPKYISYCLSKFDNFLFSRPVLDYLLEKTHSLSSESIEYLGIKMDKCDLFITKHIHDSYTNYSKTGSIIKNIHKNGIHNINNSDDYFKYIEYNKLENNINNEWFNDFFNKVVQNRPQKAGVRITGFLINHQFKRFWLSWISKNWLNYSNGEDSYTYCINILDRGCENAIIIVINTENSKFSVKTTRHGTNFQSKNLSIKTFLAHNNYLLPSIDFWRYLLTYDEKLKNNWIYNSLKYKLEKKLEEDNNKEAKRTSRVLAYKSISSFYIDDDTLSHKTKNYYTNIIKSDYYDKMMKMQEDAQNRDQLSPASDDENNYDEDAWDARTDGQYGEWDDVTK